MMIKVFSYYLIISSTKFAKNRYTNRQTVLQIIQLNIIFILNNEKTNKLA